ncbi:hypothetical protein [Daejeonia sp. YH14]|uniref:hypothetical protein n=1 Tax=Daejeonia sp. YH14 TaxID=3439042 RepID=UPI003F49985A
MDVWRSAGMGKICICLWGVPASFACPLLPSGCTLLLLALPLHCVPRHHCGVAAAIPHAGGGQPLSSSGKQKRLSHSRTAS